MRNGKVNTTRITYEQAADLLGYKQHHFFQQHFCDWHLDEIRKGATYEVRGTIKPLAYVPVFVATVLVGIPYAAWECGLRNFELPDRQIQSSVIFADDPYGQRYRECLQRMGVLA